MSNIGNLTVSLGLNTTAFKAGMAGASAQMKQTGAMMQKAGRNMSMYLTAPLLLIGAASFKVYKDWETNLSKITGLVGIAKDQVDSWKDSIMEIAVATGQGPEKLADAMFFITSAGLRGQDALDALEMSAKAAAAGLGETATIADLVTSAMNAYGSDTLSAAQATDVLVASVREGKASADSIAGALGGVLPIASAMGVSFDEVGASIAAMTRTGTSAETASMQLKSILASLLAPTKEAEQALNDMGLSSAGLRQKIKDEGLLAVLTDLKDVQGKYGDEMLATVIPNIRALSGVMDLVGGNAEANIAVFESLAATGGDLDAAFLEATQTAEFKLNKAMTQLKTSLITIGESVKNAFIPILEKLGNKLEAVGKWFGDLSEAQKRMVIGIAGLVAAAGPLLMVMGGIMQKLPGMAGGFLKLIGMMQKAAMANPYVALAMAIGLIVALIFTWGKSQEDLMQDWENLKQSFSDADVINNVMQNFVNIFDDIRSIINVVSNLFGKAGTSVGMFTGIFNVLLFTVKLALTPIIALVNGIKVFVLFIVDLFRAFKNIKDLSISDIFDLIKKAILGMLDPVFDLLDSVGMLPDAIANMRDVTTKSADKIIHAFTETKDAVKAAMITMEDQARIFTEQFAGMSEDQIKSIESVRLTYLQASKDMIAAAVQRIMTEGMMSGALTDETKKVIELTKAYQAQLDVMIATYEADNAMPTVPTISTDPNASGGAEDEMVGDIGNVDVIVESLSLLQKAQGEYAATTARTKTEVIGSFKEMLTAETEWWQKSNTSWEEGNSTRTTALADFANKTKLWNQTVKAMYTEMASTLESGLESMISATVETAAAGGSWKDIWMGLLGTIANVIVQLGKMAIGAGIAVKGIMEALKLHPALAIVGGIALVALGAGIKSGLASLSEDVQGLATGGNVVQGGVFKVGEEGEELVTLPRGSAVTPNHALGGGNTPYILTTKISGRDLEIILERTQAQGKRR